MYFEDTGDKKADKYKTLFKKAVTKTIPYQKIQKIQKQKFKRIKIKNKVL